MCLQIGRGGGETQVPFPVCSAVAGANAGVCDACGGDLYQRADDQESSIRERLQEYNKKTSPLVDWYRQRGVLVEIEGNAAPDQVNARIRNALGRG